MSAVGFYGDRTGETPVPLILLPKSATRCITPGMSRSGAKWSSGRTPGALLVAIVFLVLALAPLKADETKPLLFVGDKDYPPLTYLDNQQPAGMAVDVVKA